MASFPNYVLAHFEPQFWSLPVGLLLCALVAFFSLGAFWWEWTGGPFFEKERIQVSKRRVVNGFVALLAPITIIVGTFLVVFPAQPPKGVFLKSYSHPLDFTEDSESSWDRSLVVWKSQLDQLGIEQIDATPYVNFALVSLVAETPETGWRRESEQVNRLIANAVTAALHSNPNEMRDRKPWIESVPRWLIESVEIAVLKALLLKHNVQALTVEAHPRRTPSGHAWVGVGQYLSPDLGRYSNRGSSLSQQSNGAGYEWQGMPISEIMDKATASSSDEVPFIVGRPSFVVRKSAGSSMTMTAYFEIAWPAGASHLDVGILVNGAKELEEPLTGSYLNPTNRVHVVGPVSIEEEDRNFRATARYNGIQNELEGTVIVLQDQINIEFLGPDAAALRTTFQQLKACNNAEIVNWRLATNERSGIEAMQSTGDADVVVRHFPNEGLWIYSASLDQSILERLRSRLVPIPEADLERQYFQKVSRVETGESGAYSLYNTPLAPDSEQKYAAVNSGTARAFVVGHHPEPPLNSAYVNSLSVRPFVTSWQIREPTENRFDRATVVAIDPRQQGLVLNSRCEPAAPARYDSGRFLPIWTEVTTAIRETSLAVWPRKAAEAESRLSEPVFALDGVSQIRLKSECLALGLILQLTGLLLLICSHLRGALSARHITDRNRR